MGFKEIGVYSLSIRLPSRELGLGGRFVDDALEGKI